MERFDRLSSLFWLIISIITCIHSYQLGLGSFQSPGPGFLFFWSGSVLGTLSIIIFLRNIKKKILIEGQKNIFENVKWIKVLSVILSLIIYGLILEWLGFLLSTIFLMAFLLFSIESKKWYVVIFVSILSSLLSYVLFELCLKARLPKGILGI